MDDDKKIIAEIQLFFGKENIQGDQFNHFLYEIERAKSFQQTIKGLNRWFKAASKISMQPQEKLTVQGKFVIANKTACDDSGACYVVVPFGSAGCGKSTLCNFLLDGKNSGRFKSSKTTAGGETKTISAQSGFALGKANSKQIKVFDIPGIGDPELPLSEWVTEIKNKLLTSENIDMALIVLKAQDYRITLEEIMSLQAMSKFLENL